MVIETTDADDNYPADSEAIGAWMTECMSGARAVGGALDFRRFSDPIYILLNPISWRPDEPDSGMAEVVAPKGFVTDLASVPRVFWSLFRPDGKYAYAAAIHDWLYWDQSRTREESDDIFHVIMKEFKVRGAGTVYTAVRAGGTIAWNGNRKRKDAGERRLLTKFPEDPKITWDEWKQDDRHF